MEQNLFIVSTFYKFVSINNLPDLQLKLIKFFHEKHIVGTILLADEGINGTISASRQSIDAFYDFVKSISELSDLECKESICSYSPFSKVKIKIKPEIVKFEMKLKNPETTGKRVDSKEWEKLISQKDVMLIDTRNDYEVEFGTFKSAINPKTRNFTDLVKWLDENIGQEQKEQPIAMFCTGGVRCEKSTAYLQNKGYKNVYHLQGGILQYLSETQNKNQHWNGRCFVFDDRVAVDEKLTPMINN